MFLPQCRLQTALGRPHVARGIETYIGGKKLGLAVTSTGQNTIECSLVFTHRFRWQIALLVAGINYVLEVEATLDRVDNGDNSALTGYHDLQVRAR